MERHPVTLVDLLSNAIVVRQIAPYLPQATLRRLSATSKALRELIYADPDVWRYVDLSGVKRAQTVTPPLDIGGVSWRAEWMDESLTEDNFYAGPLRGIFSSFHSKQILSFVQTLVLDGLTVPADLVREILSEDRYNVRILSVREAKHLNITKLQQVLRYVVRPTRAEGTPKLKALYVFGPKDAPRIPQQPQREGPSLGVMGRPGAQIGAEWNQRSCNDLLAAHMLDEESKWYGRSGRVIKRPYTEWAETLQVCKGLINFDAVLCRGPKHDITKVSSKDFLQPTVATIALGPAGCETCHSSPEGPAVYGVSAEHTLPLLGPVPIHATTVRACLRSVQGGEGTYPKLILRCEDCLRGRWCERCSRWWCEDCYQEPVSRATLLTEMQQIELCEQLRANGWNSAQASPLKVYSKLCINHCLVEEMMAGAGSNGMWG